MKKYLLLLALLLCTTLALWAAPAAKPPAKPPAPAQPKPEIREWSATNEVSPTQNDVSAIYLRDDTNIIVAKLITNPANGYELIPGSAKIITSGLFDFKSSKWLLGTPTRPIFKIDPDPNTKDSAVAVSEPINPKVSTWVVVQGKLTPKAKEEGSQPPPQYDWISRLQKDDASLLIIASLNTPAPLDAAVSDAQIMSSIGSYLSNNAKAFKKIRLITVGNPPKTEWSIKGYKQHHCNTYQNLLEVLKKDKNTFDMIIWVGHAYETQQGDAHGLSVFVENNTTVDRGYVTNADITEHNLYNPAMYRANQAIIQEKSGDPQYYSFQELMAALNSKLKEHGHLVFYCCYFNEKNTLKNPEQYSTEELLNKAQAHLAPELSKTAYDELKKGSTLTYVNAGWIKFETPLKGGSTSVPGLAQPLVIQEKK